MRPRSQGTAEPPALCHAESGSERPRVPFAPWLRCCPTDRETRHTIRKSGGRRDSWACSDPGKQGLSRGALSHADVTNQLAQ